MNDTTRDIAAAIRQEVIPEGAKRLGLVIGIDQYQDPRLNLRCARADAEAMRNLMLDPECGLFDAENVTLLADEDATRESIWRALAGLRRKAHKQDCVWIYYAGHGAPEGDDFYWVPHDGDVDDLYSTGLSRRDLNRVLDDLQAERIVTFMDCCHAAAMASQKHKTRSVMNAEVAFGAYTGKGRLIFAASDGREKSVEIAEHGRGAFSYFLERGLRGEADHACAGVVTTDGLWHYLKDKVTEVARAAGNPQSPVRIGEETHHFALSLNPLEVGRRKRLAEAVRTIVGVGLDQLSTQEGHVCLEILRRKHQNDSERDLMEELNAIGNENFRVKTLRRMIAAAHPHPMSLGLLKMSSLSKPTSQDPNVCAFRNAVDQVFVASERERACIDLSVLSRGSSDAAERQRREALLLGLPIEVAFRAADMRFRFVPAGTFWMGSPTYEAGRRDDEAYHQVTLSQPFYMSVLPVTTWEWTSIVGQHPRIATNSRDFVLTEVLWDDALDFARSMNSRFPNSEGVFRLPSEAEWEYACRAGTSSAYCYGDTPSWNSMLCGESDMHENKSKSCPAVLGVRPPNAWGLHDMHGGVYELCLDWYGPIATGPATDPIGPPGGKYRVLKGGAFNSPIDNCRSAYRHTSTLTKREFTFGVRIVFAARLAKGDAPWK